MTLVASKVFKGKKKDGELKPIEHNPFTSSVAPWEAQAAPPIAQQPKLLKKTCADHRALLFP